MQSPIFASRAAGLTILTIGLALMAFSLLADTLGVGGGRGFGYEQMIVFIAGMVVVLFAGAILLQPRIGHDASDTFTQDPDPDRRI